jgi:lipoate-protein ligase A
MLQYLDYTEVDPAANLAVDEVLLDWIEESSEESPHEILRLWQPATPFVVIGRASILASEVNEAECEQRGVPILRRSSGGTAIVTGPGCLMYAVVLSLKKRPELRMIDAAHRFVLERIAKAISRCGVDAQCAGTSDVVVGGKKFSGNSLRTRRESLLYHGTILLDVDLSLMDCLSKNPPRQPDYRAGRSHASFIQNLHLPVEKVKLAIRQIWQAEQDLSEWPQERIATLVEERFGRREWTYQR